ncbi:MAG: thioredoxin fold domain-containing protein [Bacilli bacterium]
MKNVTKILIFVMILLFNNGCTKKGIGYSEISYDKLTKMIEAKENFILMISSSVCPHCDQFKLTLEEINKKYHINIKYIDIYKLENEPQKIEKIKKLFPYTGTPTTINIIDGKEQNNLSRIDGARDYIDTKEKLIKWGYIKG